MTKWPWKGKPHLSHQELGNSLDVPGGHYVLLALFPYYNHLFRTILLRAGFEVRWEDTLEGALERARHIRPSIVICWVGRGGPDGLVLLKRMHESELAGIPVVALVEQKREPEDPKAVRANAALVVPIEPVELVRCVERLLSPTHLDTRHSP